MILVLILLVACAPSDKPGDTQDSAANPNPDVACPEVWTDAGEGVWIDPTSCLAWTEPATDLMDWYDAVSPDEAGACLEYCDESPGACENLGQLAGIGSWHLPSIDDLYDVGEHEPPFPSLEGFLWAREADNYAPQNAWTLDLTSPNLGLLQDKSNLLGVRCAAGVGG